MNSTSDDVRAIMQSQILEFNVRARRKSGEVTVLKKEIQSLKESAEGYKAQITGARAQVRLFKDELRDKQQLLSKRLVRRADVLAIRRAEARAMGELGQLLGRQGEINERIARAHQQIVQVHSISAQKSTEELRSVEAELDDIRQQIRSAADVVTRTNVRAPVRGVVIKLHYHTIGGVISSGAVLMELLPVNDDLIIEARITPGDVTHVSNDQLAQVRLTALNQRLTPFIDGRVKYVSADAVNESDPRRAMLPGSANGFFVVRISLDQDDLKLKVPNFLPTPGMPAEIYIRTGERTFFEYLLQPIVNSFSRAFREN
jgi:HlyD family type I secretion membrane fusion protein